MKPELLSVIEEVFCIEGRGCVITPGIPKDCRFVVKVGYLIEIRSSGASAIASKIAGIEMICRRNSSHPLFIPIMLPRNISKVNLPAGAEVWLMEPRSAQRTEQPGSVGRDTAAKP